MAEVKLSKDQQIAVKTLTDWFNDPYWSDENDIAILKGYAGTGKSTIMDEFRKTVGLEQENVLTLATSGMAVKNIQEKSKSPNAMTISSFIKIPKKTFKLNTVDTNNKVMKSYNLQSDNSVQSGDKIFTEIEEVIQNNNLAHSKSRFMAVHNLLANAIARFRKANQNLDKQDTVRIDIQSLNDELRHLFEDTAYSVPQLHQSVEFLYRDDIGTNKFDINKRTGNTIKLIVVDEVGMVNQEDLNTILSVSANLTPPVPVIGLGDDNQLPPVRATFNDAILQEPGVHNTNNGKVTTAKLTTIHRQDANSGLSVFAQKFTKRPDGSQDQQNINQALIDVQQEIPNLNDIKYYEFNINNASYNHKIFTNANAIISWQNKVVRQLNHLVRKYRFKTPNPPAKPQAGESIIITQNEKNPDVESYKLLRNGERFIIKHVYSEDEIYHFALSDVSSKPLTSWVNQYNKVKDYVMCVDLIDKDGNTIEHCWINTYLFSNPLVKESYIINNGHNNVAAKLGNFSRVGIRSGLLNPEDVNEDHNHILYATYGYAMTVHKVQGLEFNNVIYYETPWEVMSNPSNPAARRYTAITRAKKNLLFMTGNLPN